MVVEVPSKEVPIFRWIGGKRRLTSVLNTLVPKKWGGVYREPFAGAASLFFRIRPRVAVLGDINGDLISCYESVQRNPKLVSKYIEPWAGDFDQERYLDARLRFNELRRGHFEKAALFIVLNYTCFNGIWRVNRKGRFNVPFGGRTAPALPCENRLVEYSSAFSGVEFQAADFEDQLVDARRGDFVYLDPPYPALNGTSFFTHYSKGRFPFSEQERVAQEVRRLTRLGCRVLLSNSGTENVLRLYSGFRVVRVPFTRFVAAGGARHKVVDVAILNYDESGRLLRGKRILGSKSASRLE